MLTLDGTKHTELVKDVVGSAKWLCVLQLMRVKCSGKVSWEKVLVCIRLRYFCCIVSSKGRTWAGNVSSFPRSFLDQVGLWPSSINKSSIPHSFSWFINFINHPTLLAAHFLKKVLPRIETYTITPYIQQLCFQKESIEFPQNRAVIRAKIPVGERCA